jgi:hydrogenase expression/formation protein HypC
MCLAIPGRVVSVDARDASRPTAEVDFEGQVKSVSLLYLPETSRGDYVIVQAGFAIRRVEEAEALEALALARETTLDGVHRAPGANTPVASVTNGGP